MLTLPEILVQQSNSLTDTGAWIILFQVDLTSGTTIRFANNTEDITWDGVLWNKCYFQVDDISESDKAEVPSLNVRLPNPDGTVQAAIEDINGGVGSKCTLYIVHSDNLTQTNVPAYEFKIVHAKTDSTWATFILGGANPYDKRVPQRRLIKNYCPFRFKGDLCRYSGTDAKCEKTLADCRSKNNASRFGGCPGVGSGKGFYAAY